jgi:hypothetical protein
LFCFGDALDERAQIDRSFVVADKLFGTIVILLLHLRCRLCCRCNRREREREERALAMSCRVFFLPNKQTLA